MENDKKPAVNDLFGLAPYGEALKVVIEKGFEGASALLSRICLPAAEELGLMYRDKLRYYRLKNVISIAEKTSNRIHFADNELQLSLHPRIANELFEHASLCDDETLQEMWSGLLAASIQVGHANDQNMLFANALKHLTPIQARLINFICRKCKIKMYETGLMLSGRMKISLAELVDITGCSDIYQLDAELDSLRTYNLTVGGFNAKGATLEADLSASAFLLLLFPKTQGYKDELSFFYKDQIIEGEDPDFKTNSYLVV